MGEADIIDIAYFWVVFLFLIMCFSYVTAVTSGLHLCKVLFPILSARTKKLGGDLLFKLVLQLLFF